MAAELEGRRIAILATDEVVTDGKSTGALPGGLVRGGREAVILPIAAE